MIDVNTVDIEERTRYGQPEWWVHWKEGEKRMVQKEEGPFALKDMAEKFASELRRRKYSTNM